MLAFLSGSEKGLPMECTLQEGLHGAQNLPKLSPRPSMPFQGITPHSLPDRFRTSAALVRERDKVQQPVYYCNRALRGAEGRYPKMENLILALVTTSRKPQSNHPRVATWKSHPIHETVRPLPTLALTKGWGRN